MRQSIISGRKLIMPSLFISCTFLCLATFIIKILSAAPVGPGSWKLLVQNAGVSAMHMTLTRANTVIMYDRTDYGPSQLKLPGSRCRIDPNDLALKTDCYAHSIELNLATNAVRPLEILTDTWCSSGAFQSDGTLISTGGYNDGGKAVRHFVPCFAGQNCDWNELGPRMGADRWYATNQILPDGRIIVIGGRRSFSYEYIPASANVIQLPFLMQTNEPNAENNLYPFVHLSSDGNLFIFANRKSILFNYNSNKVVKAFPDIKGGPRNYPSTGSSVMLPLSFTDGFKRVEIMICGGAPDGSFQQANKGTFVTAINTCGRIVITDPNPSWAMEGMPHPRVMGDMIILPTGEVLIINGAEEGSAGWSNARSPSMAPFLYTPTNPFGNRFHILASTTIPRLYHSTANLLPDGRILVGGSNPNVGYSFSGVLYPTELRIEAYSPYYLDPSFASQKPSITFLSNSAIGYGATFTLQFSLATSPVNVQFKLYAPPFTTHSYSMNQRQLILASTGLTKLVGGYSSTLTSPPTSVAAPAGYYLLFVVNNGIPSSAKWVHIS